MKQTLMLIGVILLLALGVFFLGTKPATAPQRDEQEVMLNTKQWSSPPPLKIDTTKSYTATIETSKGSIRVELFADEAPITVNNFVFLANERFYDGLKFHRIIKDFMVQTGDPKGDGTGGPGYTFVDEPTSRNYLRGTLAMANSGPNTNGSQFFIMTQDNVTLPKNYTIFGQIKPNDSQSFSTLDQIANTAVTDNGRGEISSPTEEIIIKQVTIEVE